MLKLEKRGKKYFKKPDNKYEKVYLIHHMHHFGSTNRIAHELHHCFLFEKKNMKGRKYSVVHETHKGNIYHCVSRGFEGVLFDHKNNMFNIRKRKIGRRRIYEIKF